MSALSLSAAGTWALPILLRLARASVAGAIAVVAIYLVVRLMPRLPPALRCGLWWLACLKLVLALVWVRPLALPLPASLAARLPGLAPVSLVRIDADRFVTEGLGDRSPGLVAPLAPSTGSRATSVSSVWAPAGSLALLALWLAGVAVGLARTVSELLAARRILRAARPIDSPALAARFAGLVRSAGLARSPALLTSPAVATPVTIGLGARLGDWLRPAVVLPAGLAELPADGLEMALCHEVVHLRRRDLWLAWVPVAAARLFFFHPLARLAAREYAVAREAACDAEVLARLAAPPAAYARLLVDFATAGHRSGAAALGAAPPPGTLRRRLLMLDSATRRPRPAWLCLAGLAALAALVPLRIVATTAPSTGGAARAAVAPLLAAAPAAALAALPPLKSPALAATGPALRSVLAVPAPARALLAVAGPRPVAGAHADDSPAEAFVLIEKGGSTTMSGSTADIARARALAGAADEVLWFRRGGHEYVVRDAGLLATARALYAPQAALGKRQGELGARQGELGARQGELGAKQGELGSRQGRLGAQQAALATRRIGAAEKDEASLDREEQQLDKQMDELSRQQDELGKQQDELGRQQDALGSAQDELGREQDRLAREADTKLHALLDGALSRGLAEEVHP